MSPKYKPVSKSPILLAGLVLIMILSACSPPVDSDIGTDSIYAKMSVECRSNGTSDVEVKPDRIIPMDDADFKDY